jgi:hypothetical protein
MVTRLAEIGETLDTLHKGLARLVAARVSGTPFALKVTDVLNERPLAFKPDTLKFLRKAARDADRPEDKERIERFLFACMELQLLKETADLSDMVDFFMQHGRMVIGTEKVPALEMTAWLQAQRDFDKREQMLAESNIFLRKVINPILTAMQEMISQCVKERFGFSDYAAFCEEWKAVSFSEYANELRRYLETSKARYDSLVGPWVQEKIGRPRDGLSRFHALHLVRIRRFDNAFRPSDTARVGKETFSGLGFYPFSSERVSLDLSTDPAKVCDGICVAIDIPDDVTVVMKPVGGLIDVETLLHELGHAFFLTHFSPDLPVEFRRLSRSPALDEAFAFLFMDLTGNPAWATDVAGLDASQAETLAAKYAAKRICLVRRQAGKFLAERSFHQGGDLKDSHYYCEFLNDATGFVYEPEGYLIDMEPKFYSFDYVRGWAGARALTEVLEAEFGLTWFSKPAAGAFLKTLCAKGRTRSLEDALFGECGIQPDDWPHRFLP